MADFKVFDAQHPEKWRDRAITESFIRDAISDIHTMSEEDIMALYTQSMLRLGQDNEDDYLVMIALMTIISILPTSTPAEILEFIADNGGFGKIMLRILSNEYRNPMAKIGDGQWIEIDQVPREFIDNAAAILGENLLDAGMDETLVSSAIELYEKLTNDDVIHDEQEVLDKLADFGTQFEP